MTGGLVQAVLWHGRPLLGKRVELSRSHAIKALDGYRWPRLRTTDRGPNEDWDGIEARLLHHVQNRRLVEANDLLLGMFGTCQTTMFALLHAHLS